MAAAASRGAAVGGSNPSGDGGGPRLQSPPGKGNKPAALIDITNTGKPNASRPISGADIIKENVRLSHLLMEKIKIIELSKIEMHKLHLALQASRQQNLQLAQANSQMLAELNTGKDRLKELQHELSCTAALLKVKDSEIERYNKTANQRREEVTSQDILKAIPSKVSAAVAHRIDGSIISAVIETQSAEPSNTGCQEPPQYSTKNRNKRKSETSERVKDTNIVQDDYKPNLQPIMSLYHEDPRKPQRRRSSRLNQGSCEINKVSDKALLENTEVSSAPSTLSVQKRHGPTIGKDMGKPRQNECDAVVNGVVMASEFKEIEIDEQPSQEANLKEIQEACSSAAAVESHQVGDEARNAKQSHLADSQAVGQSNIIEPHKPPEDTIKRKPQRRSSRLNQGSCEITEVSDKTLLENTEVSSAPSTLSVQKQHGPDKGKSLQNECNAVVNEVVMVSEFEEIEIDEQPSQEANLKQIQEACSSGAAVESHQIGDEAHNAKQSHLAESQVVQSNTIEPHKPPEDTIIKRKCMCRDSNKQKLALYERESDIEDINAKSDTSTSGTLHHEKKTKCQRRKSSRLNPAPSEEMKSTFETLKEDAVAPLAPSSSNASMEQMAALKQNDACSSMKSTEGHVPGRRSLRRAAEKVVSYKEIPLNVKMRRP
ncbi:shugoshin-1-like isoform X4 [Panicum virgatum]|uniref:shugoshin-1-like isoform X4 n=1 Tax=Panicum virgatum TaxID=38727 RepID=UPI0019D5528E|nr:shugoshin-1-like isoform X4 [Panicum virgatum]